MNRGLRVSHPDSSCGRRNAARLRAPVSRLPNPSTTAACVAEARAPFAAGDAGVPLAAAEGLQRFIIIHLSSTMLTSEAFSRPPRQRWPTHPSTAMARGTCETDERFRIGDAVTPFSPHSRPLPIVLSPRDCPTHDRLAPLRHLLPMRRRRFDRACTWHPGNSRRALQSVRSPARFSRNLRACAPGPSQLAL